MQDLCQALQLESTWTCSDNSSTCSWQGVTCDDATEVIAIDIAGLGANGTIPPSLGRVVTLQRLNFSKNQIGGYVHFDLGKLVGLTEFDLSYNNLAGSIPTSISRMSKLTTLDFSHNALIGPIPSIHTLTQLETLKLNNNRLQFVLPTSIGSLGNLKHMDLSLNRLNGSLPNEIGALTRLQYLNLSHNNFSNVVLRKVVVIQNLTLLDLSHNQFTGTIPAPITLMQNLAHLDLSFNQFNGSLPSIISTLSNLTTLNVEANLLSGSLSPELAKMTGLTSLNIKSNRLTGTLPLDMGFMPNLRILSIANNNIAGSLPLTFGNLSQLQLFEFSGNPLLGGCWPVGFLPRSCSNSTQGQFRCPPGEAPSCAAVVCEFSTEPCSYDCYHSPWSRWSECRTRSCSEKRRRERTTVLHPLGPNARPCGPLMEEEDCVDRSECMTTFAGVRGMLGEIPLGAFLAIILPILCIFILMAISVVVFFYFKKDLMIHKLLKRLPPRIFSHFNHLRIRFVNKWERRGSDLFVNQLEKETPEWDEMKSLLYDFLDGPRLTEESDPIVNAWQLYNPTLTSTFAKKKLEFEKTLNPSKEEDYAQKSPLRKWIRDSYYTKAKTYSWNTSNGNAPIFAVAYGTSLSTAWKIAHEGFSQLARNDKGIYGKGIYTSTSASYLLPTYAGKFEPAILICFVVPGHMYPVIESPKSSSTLAGLNIAKGYNSHYVCTNRDGLPTKTMKTRNFYQELILDHDSQIVPAYLIAYNRDAISPLVARFTRDANLFPTSLDHSSDSSYYQTPLVRRKHPHPNSTPNLNSNHNSNPNPSLNATHKILPPRVLYNVGQGGDGNGNGEGKGLKGSRRESGTPKDRSARIAERRVFFRERISDDKPVIHRSKPELPRTPKFSNHSAHPSPSSKPSQGATELSPSLRSNDRSHSESSYQSRLLNLNLNSPLRIAPTSNSEDEVVVRIHSPTREKSGLSSPGEAYQVDYNDPGKWSGNRDNSYDLEEGRVTDGESDSDSESGGEWEFDNENGTVMAPHAPSPTSLVAASVVDILDALKSEREDSISKPSKSPLRSMAPSTQASPKRLGSHAQMIEAPTKSASMVDELLRNGSTEDIRAELLRLIELTNMANPQGSARASDTTSDSETV